MNWIEVQPGTFTMGSRSRMLQRRGAPLNQMLVTRGFEMADIKVTQELYSSVMGALPDMEPFLADGVAIGPNYPVVGVSWNDCNAFCERASSAFGFPVRLPSEVEWEYAARGGSTGEYFWGDSLDDRGKHMTRERMTEVGMMEPNPWGFHDILGGCLEWVADEVDVDLDRGPFLKPEHYASGADFIARGGQFRIAKGASLKAGNGDPSYKVIRDAASHEAMIGFRLVRDA